MQTRLDLAQDRRCDHLIARGDLLGKRAEEIDGALYAHLGNLCDIQSAHRHAQRFRLEPLSFAVRTGLLAHVFLIGFLHVVGGRFLIPPLHGGNDALKARLVDLFAVCGSVGDGDPLIPCAVENGMHRLVGKLADRRIHGKPVFSSQRFHEGAGHAVAVRAAKAHGMQRALAQGQRFIRENDVRGDLHQIAQTRAVRARAEGAVEGKHAGTQFLDGNAAVRAGVVHGEHQFTLVEQVHDHQTARALCGRFNRVGQTLFEILSGTDDQTVHDQLNRVPFFLIKLRCFINIVDFPVHAHTHKTGFSRIIQHLPMLALLGADHRREHLETGALRILLHGIDHFVDGLLTDLTSAVRAVRDSGPRPEQTVIVMDLRHRADGRTRVSAGRFLVNRDGRAQAFNGVDIRLFHLTEELSGIAGEGFDIPPLSLRIDGIKRQRALAGPGKPGKNHQFVPWNGDADILQIMHPRAADDQFFTHADESLMIDLPRRAKGSVSQFLYSHNGHFFPFLNALSAQKARPKPGG